MLATMGNTDLAPRGVVVVRDYGRNCQGCFEFTCILQKSHATIADFGTSKWPQLTNSTGLTTNVTQPSQNTHLSFAWAAPEVLDAKGTSYASDVYSFGVVVWEIFSRQLPWADEACARDIFVRVVFKEDRPEIPADSPTDLVKVVNASWAAVPKDRPTFSNIMKGQRWE